VQGKGSRIARLVARVVAVRAALARATRKQLLFLAVAVAFFLAWTALVVKYHKWDAQWAWANVPAVAVLAAIAAVWWVRHQAWYWAAEKPARLRVLLIPAAGFVFCALVGIYFTEPIEAGGLMTRSGEISPLAAERTGVAGSYDYGETRAGNWAILADLADLGDFAGSGGDGDELCFILFLVILVIVLVVGSFFIPHFWVLGTLVLVAIMALVAYREFQVIRPALAPATSS
jgi:hypothetical protein